MQGRIPVGVGQGPGLSGYMVGDSGGSETVSLTPDGLPVRGHTTTVLQQASGAPLTSSPPNTGVVVPTTTGGTKTFGLQTTVAGGGIPHNNMQPYTTLNCIICLQGIFPARD
ncbi:hypothetical protein KFL_006100060 [Klebsormidium nitens]|uniref:Phage tail collar domain-containing protein n=1 Tax=Klebsormidium nitens TaxID=105231 RepID=A0A1Y1IPX0_KLENI|nr:hypothetical protein KFL_006100060 [Klebsormidium nitens]|eukprot:GAQ90188.1 hypothetical protein KFL_006100060 [Klebsormidium nitens]